MERLGEKLGESALFCGHPSLQIGSADVELPGLQIIRSVSSAVEAIHFIVEQGEGARSAVGSHFEKFERIKSEYHSLLTKNAAFRPARPVALNPVMRKPATPEGKVWVSDELAAKYLDLANALYDLMLHFLVQIYAMENRSEKARQTLLSSAFGLMKLISEVGSVLTRMPAAEECPVVNAGMSFALNRHLSPYEVSGEKRVLAERMQSVRTVAQSLESTSRVARSLSDICARLQQTALE